MQHLEDILVRPLISEKSNLLAEKKNCYGFVVSTEANKFQIKAAVEKLFDVKVLKVTTSVLPGKVKRTRKGEKKSSNIKRAFVQIKDGQKIEFFKGI